MQIETESSNVAPQADDVMIRPRGVIVRFFARILSTIRASIPTRYTRLTDQNEVNQSDLKGSVHRRLSSYLDLSFFCGLPLSTLLLYVDSPITLLFSFGLFFLALFVLLNFLEYALVYAVNEPPHSRLLCDTPDKYGFPVWENVKLHPDGMSGPELTGYFILNSDQAIRSSCPTIFILHGNAGNVGHRLPLCRLLSDCFPCNILIIDYRGFGRSTGRPSENGLYADARCGLDFLLGRNDITHDKIFAFGRSIGGAVAIQLASTCPESLCGVIIENSFTSLPEAAHHVLGGSSTSFIPYILPTWRFANQYTSLERLRKLARRTNPKFLFISGACDELIPPRMMRDLASVFQSLSSMPTKSEASSPAEFIRDGLGPLVSFPEGQHNTTWLSPDWPAVISRFIDKASSSAQEEIN